MANSANDGNLNGCYCSSNGFRIEDPEILHGTAATGEQDDIRLQSRCALKGVENLFFRVVALTDVGTAVTAKAGNRRAKLTKRPLELHRWVR